MEFEKEETNPLMFGYWGNKRFQEWFGYIFIQLVLTLRKPSMIFSYLLYIDWIFSAYTFT